MKSTTLPTGFVFRANTETLESTQITSTEHQSRSPQPCEEIREENSESLSDSEDDKESDTNMDDYDDAASSNIFQTLLKEGPYVEPGFDETLHHEYVVPGQKIVEVDRDRIHKKNLIFSCNLYQQHEGEAWFIGGIDGSTRVIVKSPAGNSTFNTIKCI
ncbi:uncharacterized protein [Ptychodera flava]|uniref:uncharacterized protein n=1 Tax=Ptychodera flava TaxID=63121 RepID=UPI00396AAB74